MRILVDQSGYDLLNIGDVAMLQSCVIRLRRQWPDAEIMVIAHAPARLADYCPGTVAIGRTYADLPCVRHLPRKARLGSEQVWKIASPYLSGHLDRGRRPGRLPRTAVQAVRAADLVVASGGGYVTDTWWWHAAGVLSLLSLAQRLGKPTAMFGQAIGPVSLRPLLLQASRVLPGLAALGLREDRTGHQAALSLGVEPSAIAVTGDDALELVGGAGTAGGGALGVNMRVTGYAGVDPAAAGAVGTVVLEAADALGAPVVALPVSRYEVDGDLDAIRALLAPGHHRAGVVLRDLPTPQALAAATAGCRAVVTGSYHAAVFSVAQGVPAVCVTGSSYYDAKFAGLRAQFPGACVVVPVDLPDLGRRLHSAIGEAWHLPGPARAAARDAAVRLRTAGRDLYQRFSDRVDGSPARAGVGGTGVTVGGRACGA